VDGKAMRTYSQKTQNSSIRKILKEHYYNHPLNKAPFKIKN
jgi:hypothetical protein